MVRTIGGGGEVWLIPQDPALRRDGFLRRTTCSQNDRFAIAAVRPGEYYGLAIAPDATSGRGAPEFDQSLINQSTRVTVRANESTNAEIRLITR